jgi:hypothetical protein
MRNIIWDGESIYISSCTSNSCNILSNILANFNCIFGYRFQTSHVYMYFGIDSISTYINEFLLTLASIPCTLSLSLELKQIEGTLEVEKCQSESVI